MLWKCSLAADASTELNKTCDFILWEKTYKSASYINVIFFDILVIEHRSSFFAGALM